MVKQSELVFRLQSSIFPQTVRPSLYPQYSALKLKKKSLAVDKLNFMT